MWSARNLSPGFTVGSLHFRKCRNDADRDVPAGNLECLSVHAYFNHLHRTGEYRFEQTASLRKRVACGGSGGKWIAVYAALTRVNWKSEASAALAGIRRGLGGGTVLAGATVARGAITMIAYVREVELERVPVLVRGAGVTHVIEFIHVRAVWPPLPVPGLTNYQNHLKLPPYMQHEIRLRLLH